MVENANPLRVLFVAAEAVPYSKVGGLADVAGSLPQALAAMGHDVRLVTPLHGEEPPRAAQDAEWVTTMTMGTMGHTEEAVIRKTENGGVVVYLVESPRYFKRKGVYGHPDDLERYWFFCQVALELPKRIEWGASILHCHDWHTAPLCFGLRNRAWDQPFYRTFASLLTIHNLRYRGPDELTDFLCQGIYYADKVNTVSETYAREILTPEFGEGLDKLLNLRGRDVSGIVNGLDYNEFNPATDGALTANYDASYDGLTVAERREQNLRTLLGRVNLAAEPRLPVVGMVGRLTEQKGVDIALEALTPLLEEGRIRAVILGQGEQRYVDLLQGMARRFPDRLAIVLAFADDIARLIYGGCDMFLMPSRFEPCGLGQLIAMRYGCVPVVRRTGGLNDTVHDYAEGSSTGFVFEGTEQWALRQTLDRALEVFQNKAAWQGLVRRGMERDFSWTVSARKYAELYRRALFDKGL